MKTTIELPDSLMRDVKIRAIYKGQKLKETVEELLTLGLSADAAPTPIGQPIITRDKRTGLPVIECQPAPPGEELTPERVAQILLDQEVEWLHEAGRH